MYPQNRYVFAFQRASLVAAIVTIGMATLVLLGWSFDIAIFKSLLPGLTTMKANTALCFLAAGVALWLVQTPPVDLRRVLVLRVCIFFVIALGALTLCEYVFGWDLGIDLLLFRDAAGQGTEFPGRMAPLTALCFCLMGVAFLFLEPMMRYRTSQAIMLTIGLFALLALVGYLYSVESLYRFSSYTSLALHTAAVFFILALGMLSVRPDRGWMTFVTSDNAGGVLARRLLPAAILVPIALGWLRLVGFNAGLYDTDFGVALFIILTMVVITVLIALSAASLYRIDVSRQDAEGNLQHLYAELEGRVLERTAQLTQVNQQLTREVTERERAEAQSRALLEGMPDGVVIVNGAREIVLVNSQMERLFGYLRGTVIGQSVDMLLPERMYLEPSGLRTNHFVASDAGTPSTGMELVGLRKDGSEFPMEMTLSPIDAAQGPLVAAAIRDITERKRAEQELLRLKTVLDGMTEGVQIIGFDWRYVYLNDAAAKQGLSSQDKLVGHTMMEMYPGFELTPGFKLLQKCMDERSAEHTENRFTFPDNTTGWFDLSIQPMPEGIFILTSDITQRKNAEVALRESEEKLRTLFQVLPIGVSILNDQRQIVDANPALERILGTSKEGLTNGALAGRKYIYMDGTPIPPDELPTIRALKEQQAILDVEMGVIVENGATIWTSVSAVPVPVASWGVVVVTTDITERKRIEAALAQERDMMQALMDNIPDTIYFKDTHSRFTRINRAQAHLLGVNDPHDTVGKTDADFQIMQHSRDLLAEEQLLFETGKPIIDRQELIPTGNGKPRWFSATKVPLLDTQGGVIGLIGISRDITERIKSEEALQRANDSLTVRVSQMSVLNELEGLLQACVAIGEVYQVTARMVSRLFLTEWGALYVINNSRSRVESAIVWGTPPSEELELGFGMEDCWALRRGRTHVSGTGSANLACAHIKNSTAFSICIPFLAQGETLGVFHLRAASGSDAYVWDEAQQQLAQVVADSVALALANLNLRETLRQQSIRDPLTDLFNRRFMEESLGRELLRAERNHRQVGIIMLDVDHFKQFNDTQGHATGDAVLRQLGRFLKERTRGGDIACRFGGEEFTLILPEAGLEDTRNRAEQLRRDFNAIPVHDVGRYVGSVTLSLGVAVFPQHGKTAEEILRAADTALYRAKHKGRDRVDVAESID